MKTKTEIILIITNILAWLAIAGFIIKAGAILISYGVSIGNPEGAKNLYMGMNLYNLRQFDFWHYTGVVVHMIIILGAEAYTAFLVTKVLSKIKMASPFTIEISKLLEKISYVILAIWAVAMLYNAHMQWLSKQVSGLQENLFSEESLFISGVVFVFAQIFKKGVELQSENELTV
jgi:hypothetical protein